MLGSIIFLAGVFIGWIANNVWHNIEDMRKS